MVTVSELRHRIVNLKDPSTRIVLFTLVEMSFSGQVSLEAIDKVLMIAEYEHTSYPIDEKQEE